MKKLMIAAAVAATLSLPMTTQAAGMTNAQEFCEGAIGHALDYAAEESARKLHDAEMEILTSENVNDAQKLMSVLLFHAVQRWGWEASEDVSEQEIKDFIDRMRASCMKRAEYHTPDDLSEMESDRGIF